MSDHLPFLKVRLFGGFSATYGEIPVSFGRNTTTKAMKLLQILLYHGDTGIARDKLLDELYGREDLADSANNLRVTAHRLKKIIVDAGLPAHDYINIKKGIYRWDGPMPTEVDAHYFTELNKKVQSCTDKEEKLSLLKQMCLLYRGEFLPELSGDEWILIESVLYKNLYSEALRELCELLIERGDYEETLRFCEPACKMYPFDEWQAVRIDCYMALNRYKDALQEYENTAKLFFEELGIRPSERMMQQFEQMSSRLNYTPQELGDIKQRLKEDNVRGGAYYCSLPSFRDSYRLVSRIIERNGQSVYLMLCSITNGKGMPMDKPEKLEILSQELHNTIQQCLRKGDSFTKYSPSQFLILLVGTNKENCSMIFERIQKYFSREHKSWKQYLDYFVSSVAEVEQKDSPIQFNTENKTW